MTSIPDGFSKKPKPKSIAEAVNQNSHDRLKTIAKSALQGYISSYLDTNGIHRSFVSATSPAGLTFVTDKSLQDSKDPQYRPTQLARMYNEIREKLPSILIIDTGFQWVTSGLNGGLEFVSGVNGRWQGVYRITGKVPVTVAVVTPDQETTDMLMNVVMFLFDTFRNLAGGSRLRSASQDDAWEVRIPMTFTVSANTAQEYENDPVGRFWSASIDLELDVEDIVELEMEVPKVSVGRGIIGSINGAVGTPQIISPTSVSLKDGPFLISITHYNPAIHSIYVDDPDIASIDMGNLIYIMPHRVGKIKLSLVDTAHQAGKTNPKAPFVNKEIFSMEVTINF